MNENNINLQVAVSGNTNLTTYAWTDGTMQEAASACVGVSAAEAAISRMYIHVNMPELPGNPRILKAELTVHQDSCVNELGTAPKLGLFQVTESITAGACTPARDSHPIDFAIMKAVEDEGAESVCYVFDITKLIDAVNKGESSNQNLVLKLLDETVSVDSYATLCGSSDSEWKPLVSITYASSYGINTAYPAHTHELGRFGQGSIDLVCGKLMFESQDFAWAGNRMPVTLKHLYNSALCDHPYTGNGDIMLNTADFSAMHIGLGWKLNIMQSMVPITYQNEEGQHNGYVYIGENGDETYFKCREDQSTIYEAVTYSDMVYDSENRTLVQGGETYLFDTAGRLIRIADEHSSVDITYTDNRITAVTDGVGRSFSLAYNSDSQLVSITAPDNTVISYTYTGSLLSGVIYPDGTKAAITYDGNKPHSVSINDGDDNCLYMVSYTFTGDRVTRAAEYGADASAEGKWSTYDYSAASRRTIVQSAEKADESEGEVKDNILVTVYTFDNEGNAVSAYAYARDTGKLGIDGAGSGIHPYFGDGGVQAVNASQNMLTEHSFESIRNWQTVNTNANDAVVSTLKDRSLAKYGENLLCIQSSNSENTGIGVFKRGPLNTGTYTFSAYLRPVSGTGCVYLRVSDLDGNVLTESERLSKAEPDYVRLAVSFDLEDDQTVKTQILFDGEGEAYADAVQLETNPFATPYNLLEDSSFDSMNLAWTLSEGADYATDVCFNGYNSMKITGDLDSARSASQSVFVRTDRTARESFTLSGWAKGSGLPNHEREGCPDAQFRLRAVVHYNDAEYDDTGSETFTADFSPCTEEWQYASVSFSKSKYRTVDHIEVFCDYDYNCGEVWFDDLALIRNSLETGLSPSDFPEEDYDESDTEETEDPYALPDFEELTDEFGNPLTETTFTDGAFGTMYRSFAYDENGNDLIRETDARGNVTTYTVDPATSRNQAVTDRCGNQTAYAYDAAGRTAKVTAKDAQDTTLAEVSYTYDPFDNLTGIVRGDGMKYVLNYNEFHNLSSIGVDGKDAPLVSYAYKTGNGRLKQITYANGDTMKASYNSLGHLIGEKWYNSVGTLTAHYQYGYDTQGNIVRTVDILAGKEYIYTYEDGTLVRAVEYDITLNEDGFISAKTKVNTLRYLYNEQGIMVRKHVTFANNREQITLLDTGEDDVTTTHIRVNGEYISSISKTDAFGRKEYDELQVGRGVLARQFSYHEGKITDEHRDNAKIKSVPTTHLVSRIMFSDGRSLSYEYDAEERITRVMESDGETFVSTTSYTYDAQGQLLTETVNGNLVNAMTYDAYGNILTKNGKEYKYGDAAWKDLLTSYNGQAIGYDTQGNPVRYLGHDLIWEKGRQLKSFDGNTYTYNANSIRTSKTIDGVTHTYILDGTKILREVWGDNELIPLYDNEDSVCGIVYNDHPFYFQKNLQGDVIAVTDWAGLIVARYTYDAWGKCTIIEDTSDHNIATINPFRYRGYYYDAEIQMYYLQSRYYDPEIGRFINGDEASMLLVNCDNIAVDLWTYAFNSPVIYTDDTGYSAVIVIAGVKITLSQILAAVAVIAVVVFAVALIFDKNLRNIVSSAIRAVWNYAVNTVGYLATAISEAVATAKKSRQYSGTELHHIVAQSDRRAKQSRLLLYKYGLSPYMAYNLVAISKTLHKHLHTSAYHYAVYLVLKACEIRGSTHGARLIHVLAGLILIRTLLSTASSEM